VGSPVALSAVVVDVQARSSEQVTVLSLELTESDAKSLAGVPSAQIAVVAVGGH
jgi:hypothetical protein